MSNIKNLVGQKFGRLTIVEMTEKRSKSGGNVIWKCACDCGKEVFVNSALLRSASTTSCGCLLVERRMKAITKHGHCLHGKRTKEYKAWENIKERSLNPNYEHYKNYGGRGITLCADWLKFENFLAYLKANNMYPKPDGTSIDRINNDGNYEPGNIRWSTPIQQANNRRKRK